MEIKQRKVPIGEIQIGMYVSGLDRPWTQTPFPLQGFNILSDADIKKLTHYCNYIYIDVAKSRNTQGYERVKRAVAPAGKNEEKKSQELPKQIIARVRPIPINRSVYLKRTPLKKEKKRAEKFHKEVTSAVKDVFTQISEGRPLAYQQAKKSTQKMVESIIRNPDAFSWLGQIKEKDEHTYSHSVRSSILATLFGRYIGLRVVDLEDLALAVLLKDVGKVKIEKSLWDLSELDGDKRVEGGRFLDYSVSILKSIEGVSEKVLTIVETHCERYNGSGFPNGIMGDKIPLLGKVAGIVSCYDAITNPRASVPIAPSKAIAHLYKTIDVEFQQDVVLEFIKAIGIYPTGTLVELSTGDIGVVVEQNEQRRLRPKVVLLVDSDNKRYKSPRSVDLFTDTISDDQTGKWSKGKRNVQEVEIRRDLEPGDYDIDLTQARDTHLFKHWGFPKSSYFKKMP